MPASNSEPLWGACRDLLAVDGARSQHETARDLAQFLADDVTTELERLVAPPEPEDQAEYAVDSRQLRYREAHAFMTGASDSWSATDPAELRTVLQTFAEAAGIELALRRAAVCETGAALLSALVRDTVRQVLWTVVVEAEEPVANPAHVALERLLPTTRSLRAKLEARVRRRRRAA